MGTIIAMTADTRANGDTQYCYIPIFFTVHAESECAANRARKRKHQFFVHANDADRARPSAAVITPSFAAYFFPQQHPDLSSDLAPAGVDRNFCRQPSQQK
jgi:hypothetical protein